MYKISTIWSLTTLPNLLLCLSSNKSRKLTKQEETKYKHEIHTRRMVQTQHTRQRYTLIASSKTQHGYELSSKHNISTHVDKIKDMFTLESPNDFFNIHEEQNAIFTKD